MRAASGQWESQAVTPLCSCGPFWLVLNSLALSARLGAQAGSLRQGLQVRPPRRPCSVPAPRAPFPQPATRNPLEHAPGVRVASQPEA